MVCKKMAVQFTLSRMFQLVAVVAVVCSLFATVAFPWAVLLLAEMNGVACIGFYIVGKSRLSKLAGATLGLVFTALVNSIAALLDAAGSNSILKTCWPWWPWWLLACLSQLATVLCWLFSGSPSAAAKQ